MKNSALLSLLKVQMWSRFKLNELAAKDSGKKRRNTILMGAAILLVTLMLSGYCFGLGYGLGYMGLWDLIPAYALVLLALVSVVFTILKTNGVLFGYRDYDIIMSLPIKASTVIHSRFLTMYLMNLLLTLFSMVPMGIAYICWAAPLASFYPMWLLGMLAAPLIPTTIATIIGTLIMAFSSRFKYANGLSIILTFVLIIGVLGASMTMVNIPESSFNIENMKQLGAFAYKQMCSVYPLAGMFSLAITQSSWTSFLGFLGISAVTYYLFVTLLSLKYGAINSGITGRVTKSNYRVTSLKTSSPLKALYKKELKRFFTTSIYVTNTGVGVILAVLFAFIVLIVGPEKLDALLEMPGLLENFMKIIPFLIAGILSMTCSTASALSLEGKNLWILKSLPLAPRTIFNSKILVNLTLLLPAALLSSFLLTAQFGPDVYTAFLFFAIPLVFSCSTSVVGMYLNIRMPNYQWTSEITVVKQSLCTMIGMLGNVLVAIACVGVLFLFSWLDYRIVSTILLLLIAGATAWIYGKVCRSSL